MYLLYTPLLEKGSAGHGRGGTTDIFSHDLIFGYLTTERPKSEIQGWLKRTRCPKPRGAIWKGPQGLRDRKAEGLSNPNKLFYRWRNWGPAMKWPFIQLIGAEWPFEPWSRGSQAGVSTSQDTSGNNGGIWSKGISFTVFRWLSGPLSANSWGPGYWTEDGSDPRIHYLYPHVFHLYKFRAKSQKRRMDKLIGAIFIGAVGFCLVTKRNR